jgi:MoxR-like ATPase
MIWSKAIYRRFLIKRFVMEEKKLSENPALPEIKEEVEKFRSDFERVREEISKVIVGQEEIIRFSMTGLILGGHVLLEGVPGLGKTRLVRTMSDVLGLAFSRIQFTPDLMPADITGTNILTEEVSGQRKFEFQKGPIFANLILADEINRATPKTQSALLEAMQELSVTVSRKTYSLNEPFFVMATQNPIEMEGTYPLPEAQIDRFLFKLVMNFPDRGELQKIVDRTTCGKDIALTRILEGGRILEMRKICLSTPAAEHVVDFALKIVTATHPESSDAPDEVKRFVRYGASPRGAQAILMSAKAFALLDGRFHVSTDDIKLAAPHALRHRIILSFEGEAERVKVDDLIDRIIRSIIHYS